MVRRALGTAKRGEVQLAAAHTASWRLIVIHGDEIMLLESGISISPKLLEAVGIYEGSVCWGVWAPNPDDTEHAGDPMPRHLIISPIFPRLWPGGVWVELHVADGDEHPGQLARISTLLMEKNISLYHTRGNPVDHNVASIMFIAEDVQVTPVLRRVRERLTKIRQQPGFWKVLNWPYLRRQWELQVSTESPGVNEYLARVLGSQSQRIAADRRGSRRGDSDEELQTMTTPGGKTQLKLDPTLVAQAIQYAVYAENVIEAYRSAFQAYLRWKLMSLHAEGGNLFSQQGFDRTRAFPYSADMNSGTPERDPKGVLVERAARNSEIVFDELTLIEDRTSKLIKKMKRLREKVGDGNKWSSAFLETHAPQGLFHSWLYGMSAVQPMRFVYSEEATELKVDARESEFWYEVERWCRKPARVACSFFPSELTIRVCFRDDMVKMPIGGNPVRPPSGPHIQMENVETSRIRLHLIVETRRRDATLPKYGYSSVGLISRITRTLHEHKVHLTRVTSNYTRRDGEYETGVFDFVGLVPRSLVRTEQELERILSYAKAAVQGEPDRTDCSATDMSWIRYDDVDTLFLSSRIRLFQRKPQLRKLLKAEATKHGFHLQFFDYPDDSVSRTVEKELRVSTAFLLILPLLPGSDNVIESPSDVKTDWCNYEFGFAKALGIPRAVCVDTINLRDTEDWRNRLQFTPDQTLFDFDSGEDSIQVVEKIAEALAYLRRKVMQR